MTKKTLLSWSSGKDSAWTLHLLRRQPDIDVAGLFCTVNRAFGRVAMHGVRRSLLELQAQSAGLPLNIIEIPHPCGNETYQNRMRAFVEEAKRDGVDCFAFGDLFLEDIRRYREDNLRGTGISPLFPLWGLPTGELAADMIAGGLKARITCIDPRRLPARLAGREFDAAFLRDLPDGVDPCGENGEFHSFVYDGPMFSRPIEPVAGATVSRDGFVFADLTAA